MIPANAYEITVINDHMRKRKPRPGSFTTCHPFMHIQI